MRIAYRGLASLIVLASMIHFSALAGSSELDEEEVGPTDEWGIVNDDPSIVANKLRELTQPLNDSGEWLAAALRGNASKVASALASHPNYQPKLGEHYFIRLIDELLQRLRQRLGDDEKRVSPEQTIDLIFSVAALSARLTTEQLRDDEPKEKASVLDRLHRHARSASGTIRRTASGLLGKLRHSPILSKRKGNAINPGEESADESTVSNEANLFSDAQDILEAVAWMTNPKSIKCNNVDAERHLSTLLSLLRLIPDPTSSSSAKKQDNAVTNLSRVLFTLLRSEVQQPFQCSQFWGVALRVLFHIDAEVCKPFVACDVRVQELIADVILRKLISTDVDILQRLEEKAKPGIEPNPLMNRLFVRLAKTLADEKRRNDISADYFQVGYVIRLFTQLVCDARVDVFDDPMFKDNLKRNWGVFEELRTLARAEIARRTAGKLPLTRRPSPRGASNGALVIDERPDLIKKALARRASNSAVRTDLKRRSTGADDADAVDDVRKEFEKHRRSTGADDADVIAQVRREYGVLLGLDNNNNIPRPSVEAEPEFAPEYKDEESVPEDSEEVQHFEAVRRFPFIGSGGSGM